MILNLLQSKAFRKKLSILLCVSIIFNSVFLPVAYAEEVSETENPVNQEPSPTPETTSETQTQSNPPAPTETPAPTSEITTGDAGSLASSDNTVNYTETTTEGDVATGDCSVDVNVECNPSTSNDAEVNGETAATSTSGGNGITDASGNAEIGTGDAV